MLQEVHGIQLHLYKDGTVRRRIERRVGLLAMRSTRAYLSELRANPEELERLYVDLLIGVTRFFRDEGAFAALEHHLSVLQHRTQLRVWVPACATGEEAYSVGMLLMDAFPEPDSFKIFATDLHHRSIAVAGRGVYTAKALEGVSPERQRRFFEPTEEGFRVTKELRDRVVFATHDLLTDPPFLKMDLVSCRNLLIYFNNAGQEAALSRLVFSLDTDGLLFLGPSEIPGSVARALQTLDPRWRVFRKTQATRSPDAMIVPRSLTPLPITGRAATPRVAQMQAYDTLLAEFAPPGLLVDSDRGLLHVFGEGSALLEVRPGRPAQDVLDMLKGPLRGPLGAALFRAGERNTRVQTALELGGVPTEVVVRPLATVSGDRCFLITVGAPLHRSEPPVDLLQYAALTDEALQQELSWTRHSLQVAIEVAETSNEELQASNEELVAANEELQSTNEELQSVNEELHTVNAEYEVKNHELMSLTTDLENLLRASAIGVVFVDAQLRIRKFTQRAEQLFNLRAGDEGRPIEQLATMPGHRVALEMARAAAKGVPVADQELELGEGQTFLLQVRPYLQDQRLDGVVLSFVDISALKAAEASVTLRQEVLDVITHGVGIWRLEDPDDAGSFRFLYANRAAHPFSGLDHTRLLGLTAREAAPAAVEAGIFERYRQVVLTGEPSSVTFRSTDARSRPQVVRQTASRGPQQTVVIFYEDVTDEVNRREEAEAARRVTSIGELSGHIAHDLNNLIGVILLTANSALDSEPVDALREDLEVVLQSAHRAADLVAQLMAYAKRRPVAPREVALGELLSRLRPVLQSAVGNAELQLEVQQDLWLVRVDPTALEQVFVNLATNARDAFAAGAGTLRIQARNLVDKGAPSGILVEVSDNGPGMPEEVLRRCFDPFYSTKPKGLGTGLDLSGAQGIIQQSGGSMWADSRPDHGTTFFVRLPLAASRSAPALATPPQLRGAGQRVILVDDEPELLRASARILRTRGFVVQEFACGGEALAYLRREGAPDVLVTDVLMPQMNGPTLAEHARGLFPDLPVLFVSGYADHAGVRNIAWELNEHHFLEKPFSPEELVQSVLETLARHSPR